jgi:CheY-like chemotaxis protein
MSNGPRFKLLVVDDEPLVLRAMARRLRTAGHTLTLAASVAEAKAQAGPFECAVLDIDLPDGDGISLARDLLSAGSVPVVVFYSGSADPNVPLAASELGSFVSKGDGLDALLVAVEEAVPEGAAARVAVSGGNDLRARDPRLRSGFRRKR